MFTDVAYAADLIPAVRANLIQPSYRFSVSSGTIRRDPDPSEVNPRGLPEPRISEASVREISLTAFPADPMASVEVVSPAAVAA